MGLWVKLTVCFALIFPDVVFVLHFTVSSTEVNVYFDPSFNIIQKWQITDQNRTLPLNLYLPSETNKQWISVIFLHATQGLRLISQRPIEFYPNYVQRVDMNLLTLKRGKNVSSIQLEESSSTRSWCWNAILLKAEQGCIGINSIIGGFSPCSRLIMFTADTSDSRV